MKKYLITPFILKTEEEKAIYLQYSLVDIKKNEKMKFYKTKPYSLKFYLENQTKIIKFFRKIFVLNDNIAEVYLKPVIRQHQNNYLYYERKNFWNNIKKLTFEQLFLEEKIVIDSIKKFDFYIKFGFRNIDIPKGVRIIFDTLKIEIYSTGEYSYIMEIDKKSELYNFF